MDGRLWARVYQAVGRLRQARLRPGQRFSDGEVVAVYLWSVLNDRPTVWACRAGNAPPELRGRRLPSQPTMSRRLRAPSVRALLRAVERRVAPRRRGRSDKYVDAKALPVSRVSKDRQATCGRGAGGMARGYKLHVVIDERGALRAWRVEPMNVAETTAARALIGALDGAGYLVGDSAYDAGPLYDLAHARGHQLTAARRRPGGGFGHRPQSPWRLRGLAIQSRRLGRRLNRDRLRVERFFGQLTSFGGGLSPLPAWVRTLPRVTRWVQAKLIFNAVRMALAA